MVKQYCKMINSMILVRQNCFANQMVNNKRFILIYSFGHFLKEMSIDTGFQCQLAPP